jgi:hypothetical protein
MKRLWIALLIITIATASYAQVEGGLYQAEDTSTFTYSGTGWTQIVSGDYSYMESIDLNDSVELEFTGSSIIIYRDLLPELSSPAEVEVCIDASCTNVSNESGALTEQRSVPIAFFSDSIPATLTITNLDGGNFHFDYLIVMPGDELHSIIAPEPSVHYLTLESGRIVAVDFKISGGDIVTTVFLSFLSALTMFKIVMDRWHHE